jgi:glucose-1-phosphate thymidylyltransferase
MVRFFKTGSVDEWMDWEIKNVTVETNSRMLGFLHKTRFSSQNGQVRTIQIIPPCYIGRCGLDKCKQWDLMYLWEKELM